MRDINYQQGHQKDSTEQVGYFKRRDFLSLVDVLQKNSPLVEKVNNELKYEKYHNLVDIVRIVTWEKICVFNHSLCCSHLLGFITIITIHVQDYSSLSEQGYSFLMHVQHSKDSAYFSQSLTNFYFFMVFPAYNRHPNFSKMFLLLWFLFLLTLRAVAFQLILKKCATRNLFSSVISISDHLSTKYDFVGSLSS